jgi:nicotinate-nucleotide adenylyltransferase
MSNSTDGSLEPLVLLGGTFDPVHYGHLRCGEEARQALGVETVSLLPAGQPVHRATPRATAVQRLEMLRLAIEEFPHLNIDDREIRRDGPSYMVDTLKDIRQQWPQRPVTLLIGQDAVNRLDTWYQWVELFDLAHIVILTRPSSHAAYSQELSELIQSRQAQTATQLLTSPAGNVLSLRVAAIDVSATMIKSIIRLGRSPKGMLPASVLTYIDENTLYLPRADAVPAINTATD